MKEADVRRKVFRIARNLGYWPITQSDTSICPHCKGKVKPRIGRPDTLWLHPSAPSRVCEVKVLRAGETSFSFDSVTPEQRNWLDRWEANGGLGYLGLGVLGRHGSRTHLDHLYLVDWAAWQRIEELISPIQNSIPLVADKGMRRELQDNRYDVVTLLAPYAIERESRQWRIPPDHSVWPTEGTT